MTDATVVDVNSKTSLAKAWVAAFVRKDLAKWKGALTSLSNIAATGAMVWYVLGPIMVNKATNEQQAEIASLKVSVDAKDLVIGAFKTEIAQLKNDMGAVKLGYQASQQDNAELAKKNDEMRKQIEAKGEGQKQPLQTASIAPERPKVKRVKTKPIEVPKDEPSTCQQIEACKAFVAWYEANVGTGAN